MKTKKVDLVYLAKNLPFRQIFNLKKNIVPAGVCLDSRLIKPGDLFVCRKGRNYNSAVFIPKIKGRACGIIGNFQDKDLILRLAGKGAPVFLTSNTEKILPQLWDIFYKSA